MSGMTFHDFVEMGRQIHQRESGVDFSCAETEEFDLQMEESNFS